MVDENYFRKLRNLVSTCPKSDFSWSELAAGDKTLPAADNTYEATRRLVADFLNLVSGGQVAAMLDDVLSPREKEDLPALGSRGDNNGSKRLIKLNGILKKSPPLKPWTMRASVDSTTRLEIEITARRCLAYLSGGQVIPLLEDILYPNEKECFCTKYRIGFVRIGEAVRGLHPKSKAIVLSAIRQSGFTKEDLRELNWTFSSHLWNVGNFALPGIQTEDHSYPPGVMTYSTHSSSTTTTTMPPVPAPRTQLHQSTTTSTTHSRTVKTTTMRRGAGGGGGGGRAETGGRRVRRRRKARGRAKNKPTLLRPDSDDDDQDDEEDESSDEVDKPLDGTSKANKNNVHDGKNVQNRIFLNNFITKSGGGDKGENGKRDSSSDSDPEEGIKKNPMFPLLY